MLCTPFFVMTPSSSHPQTAMIRVRGARTHNLRMWMWTCRGKLVVLTGVSGSGKSRWPSTRCMRRGSGATCRVCPLMRGSF